MFKVCNRCLTHQVISGFHKVSKNLDGYANTCKVCVNERNREHSRKDDAIIKRRKRYESLRCDPESIHKNRKYSRKNYNSLLGRAKSLLKTTKRISSKFGNTEDPVDLDFIVSRLEFGKCEVTGIRFELDNRFSTCKNPLSPSIDRMDSNVGYSKSNTRIVLWQYNLMKGELTDSELLDIFGEYFRDKLGI